MTGGTPSNLPVQLTSFVGRERELAELKNALATTRLVTLTGPGGCGKTRLALRLAGDLVDERPDGVWLIELGPLTDPDLVPITTARSVGVHPQPERPLIETLVGGLESKCALLVVDNCEHLIDAAADLVSRLLTGCPHLLVLATSRASLRVDGESVWHVPELAEAERLFVERASLVDSGFTVTGPAAAALSEVCTRLDRLPLAIELAAARARTLSVEEILARLGDSLPVLTSGGRSTDLRHRTLEATIDWSHNLLDQRERLIFRRMAVFAGGCRLDSAEAVCAGGKLPRESVLNDLERLVDQSLIVADHRGGSTRFRMLETVRSYANERLSERGESTRFRRRHAEHFLSLAEDLSPADGLLGSTDLPTRERQDEEKDNFRAALSWWLEHVPHQELRLAVALFRYWFDSSSYSEGRAWLLGGIARSHERDLIHARALYMAATLSHRLGDYGDVWELGEQAKSIFTRLGDRRGVATLQHTLGIIARTQGDLSKARSTFAQALQTFEDLGDADGVGTLKHQLAFLALLEGDLVQAETMIGESQAAFGGSTAPNAAWSLVMRGLLHMHRGEVAEARSDYLEALRRLGPTGPLDFSVRAALGLAGIAAAEGRSMAALRLAGAASAIFLRTSYQMPPDYQRELDRWIHPARRALPEIDAQVAWAEGQAMTPEQAFALALEVGAQARPGTARAARRPGGLTRRQLEVAAMVAEGFTNRQIADRLVITERTAEGHVEQIRNKLGFSSRSQVAAWAVEHGVSAPT
jgi:non-specific serine/threonine protein kinase